MIRITDKTQCCGCAACVQACPKQCFSFEEDEQGFRYPLVDIDICIECGRCEKVCPVIHQNEPRQPLDVYAAKSKDEELRRQSSSGGLFTELAHAVIAQGGVVYGAAFDENMEVRHIGVDSLDDLKKFRGSKYLQSRIENAFTEIRDHLKNERMVLFSGTSCQVAGLKRFLGKEYESLLTVDVVCHGVPSPKVWRDYLEETIRTKCVAGKNTVSNVSKGYLHELEVNFRDKRNGWKKYGFAAKLSPSEGDKNSVSPPQKPEELFYEPMAENLFMRYFLKDMGLRPSCYACPAKSGKCGSDITLGDFWGIWKTHPEFDDDKGTSLVLVNTEKGRKLFELLKVNHIRATYSEALAGNPALVRSPKISTNVNLFWTLYHKKGLKAISVVLKRMQPKKPNLLKRMWRKVTRFVKRHL